MRDIRVLSYSKCQSANCSISKSIFRNLALLRVVIEDHIFGPGLLNYCSAPITITITSYIEITYYYYYYVIYLNSLLLLLLLLHHIFKHPVTITITITRNIKQAYYYYYYFPSTITITITFPLLLHLLLLLNQRNTTQADYKVIFNDLYYLHCITHYHRHIIIDNVILKLSWKFCGVIVSNRESNSLLLANAATYYYYYYR